MIWYGMEGRSSSSPGWNEQSKYMSEKSEDGKFEVEVDEESGRKGEEKHTH